MSRPLQLILVLAFGAALSPLLLALTDEERAAIEERIRPYGQACLEGDENCGQAMAAASTESTATAAARSGKEVYDTSCATCHAAGIAGAPVLGDAASWEPRIAQGIDVLYEVGIQGKAGTTMIAKGGCFNCSDEEIRAAVDYMVEAVP